MKAWLGTFASQEIIALHDLGDVTLVSEDSQMSPDELVQKEIRTITLKITVWETGWQENRNLMDQIRAFFRTGGSSAAAPNLKLVEDDHTFVSSGTGDEVAVTGQTVMNRQVQIISHSLPEDPNAWGTYLQEITMTFRFEVTDYRSGSTDHLRATWTKTASGVTLTLGNVTGWKQDYKATRYNEMRSNRERANGTVTATGEFLADTTASVAARRAELQTVLASWEDKIESKDGALVYGLPSSTEFFNKTVRIDDFNAEINQAVTCIKWSLTASYTRFPDESDYAAADFTAGVTEEPESGDSVLTIQGTVGSNSEVNALAKLATVRTAALAAASFASNQVVRSEKTSRQLDGDDGEAFIQLSFSETYRKRLTGIESFTLNISDSDDTKSGLLIRTYSGAVVASGSTADAAYAAGAAKARLLGDNKTGFRIAAKISRVDRLVKGSQENVRVEFEFGYQLKASRIYLESASEISTETFGDSSESVSGFVVAASDAAARAAYATYVRNAYNARVVRNERTTSSNQKLAEGSYVAGVWTPTSGVATQFVKLDFSFSCAKAKTAGEYAIRYGFSVDQDYLTLKKTVTFSGTFSGTEAFITAVRDETVGNKLDAFISTIIPSGGILTNRRRETQHEKVGDSTASAVLSLSFSETYECPLTGDDQVLSSTVSETIRYSGTRWVAGAIPDGASVMMNCGTEPGERTVSGEIVAVTETSAMAMVDALRQLAFPAGVGGGDAPGTRYTAPPEITRSWEFLPITDPDPRGGSANARFCRVSFSFRETLPTYAYVTA